MPAESGSVVVRGRDKLQAGRSRKFVVVIHDDETWTGELYPTQRGGESRRQFTGYAEFVKASVAPWGKRSRSSRR